MDQLYDYIEEICGNDRNKLCDIIYTIPLKNLLDLGLELFTRTEDGAAGIVELPKTPFTFAFSDRLISNRSACSELQCRVNKSYEFALFNSLYTDKGIIPNIFDWLYDYDFSGIDDANSFYFRTRIIGDIIFMLDVRHLIKQGILQVQPAIGMFCADCLKKVKEFEKKVQSSLDRVELEVQNQLLENISIFVDKPNELVLIGSEDYIEHGFIRLISEEFSKSKLLNSISKFPYELKKDEIIKEKIARDLIVFPAMDCLTSMRWNPHTEIKAGYVAGSKVEVDIIESMKQITNESHYSNLFQSLSHSLPFLKDVDLDNAIKFRQSNEEYFIRYRESIGKILKELPSDANKRDYSEALISYITPNIEKLEKIFEKNRKSLNKKVTSTVIFDVVSLGIGYLGGLNSPGIVAAAPAAINTLKEIKLFIDEKRENDQELKNDELYYLWKVQRK